VRLLLCRAAEAARPSKSVALPTELPGQGGTIIAGESRSSTGLPGVSDDRSDTRADSTRERIVLAAIEALKSQGFTGASARAIATTGGFNQALVFYHFGTVNDLLLAALDRISGERMARYREAVLEARTLPELVETAERIYREDLESGHITVLAEIISGSSSVPGLGEEIVARMDPWVRFTEQTVQRVLAGSPFEHLVPPQQLAKVIVALYLGLEITTHLEGDRSQATELFETARRLSMTLGPLLGSSTPPEGRRP